MASSFPPPSKRRRKETRVTSNVVLRLSEEICESLNVQELLKYVKIPELNFLTIEERQSLRTLLCDPNWPSGYLSSTVLDFLETREESKKEDDFRKFIACVSRASEHRGHKELTKFFRAKLGEEEWLVIKRIEDESRTPLPSPYATPQNSL